MRLLAILSFPELFPERKTLYDLLLGTASDVVFVQWLDLHSAEPNVVAQAHGMPRCFQRFVRWPGTPSVSS